MQSSCTSAFIDHNLLTSFRLVLQVNGHSNGTLQNVSTSTNSPVKVTCGVLVSPCGRPFPTEGSLTRYVHINLITALTRPSITSQLTSFLTSFRKWRDQMWCASLKLETAWSVHQHVQSKCIRWWTSVGYTSEKLLLHFMSCGDFYSKMCFFLGSLHFSIQA